jgi:hypothetical protein
VRARSRRRSHAVRHKFGQQEQWSEHQGFVDELLKLLTLLNAQVRRRTLETLAGPAVAAPNHARPKQAAAVLVTVKGKSLRDGLRHP